MVPTALSQKFDPLDLEALDRLDLEVLDGLREFVCLLIEARLCSRSAEEEDALRTQILALAETHSIYQRRRDHSLH